MSPKASQVKLPTSRQLMWPTLQAVRQIGDSGTVEEIVEKVIDQEGFTEQQQAVQHTDGRMSEIEYRLAWARTHLKAAGALANSKRGVWSTTELGRSMNPDDVMRRYAEHLEESRKRRKAKDRSDSDRIDDDSGTNTVSDETRDWKEQLLARVLSLEPDQFERLSRRLLREAGFISVTVTGQPGDGGIDGIGVYRLSLVSFPVFFQCKRYRGSVGSRAVRDFRGAMAGRGDKGLLITSGNFTPDAKQEATRDGAPPVDLIDGDRLCDLLKEYELGVKKTIRQFEDVEIVPRFFDDI